jgi:tRNA-binding protein
MKDIINFEDFLKVDMRVGTIVGAERFNEAQKPSYKLRIDFGEKLGIKQSSAQITKLYQPSDLIGKQIVAVINFRSKQIANFMSECLVLGVEGLDKEVSLLVADKAMPNGFKIG